MSYEKIRSISIKDNQVWINSKANNDDCPFKTWHCTSLTEVLLNEGKEAAEVAILKAYEEGNFQSTDSVKNKYTIALRILWKMEEYKNFNWRNTSFSEGDPVQANRNSEKFTELLKLALNTKPGPTEKFIVIKYSVGEKYYLMKLLNGRARFSPYEKEAKIFDDREDMETKKKGFVNGEEWIIEVISSGPL